MNIIRKSKNIKLKHISLKFDIENGNLFKCKLDVDNDKLSIYCFDFNSVYYYQNKIEFIHDTTILKILA